MADVIVQEFTAGEGVGQAEVDEESIRLMEELGLEGQLTRIKPGEKSVNPYSKMTVSQKVVFGTLLSAHVDVRKYAKGPIPLRVLQIASHAAQFFKNVEVWYEPTEPDPLLVGLAKEKDSDYEAGCFMLARWGDVLEEWGVLVARARVKLVEKFRGELQDRISDSQAKLTSLDSLVTRKLAGEYVGL